MLTCHALALGLEEDDLLSACLLHDVCEDCGVKPEELPVNKETREAVRLLTKPEGFHKTEKEYQTYYDGISKNRIAIMVKFLDGEGAERVSALLQSAFPDQISHEQCTGSDAAPYAFLCGRNDIKRFDSRSLRVVKSRLSGGFIVSCREM